MGSPAQMSREEEFWISTWPYFQSYSNPHRLVSTICTCPYRGAVSVHSELSIKGCSPLLIILSLALSDEPLFCMTAHHSDAFIISNKPVSLMHFYMYTRKSINTFFSCYCSCVFSNCKGSGEKVCLVALESKARDWYTSCVLRNERP